MILNTSDELIQLKEKTITAAVETEIEINYMWLLCL